jgi:hypothetical protein
MLLIVATSNQSITVFARMQESDFNLAEINIKLDKFTNISL